MALDIISADEVVISPRGRKATYNEEMLAAFKSLKPNQAIPLASVYGKVKKEERATVSQKIRKHWKHVRPSDDCRIDFTPDGVAQVRVRVKS